MLVTSYSTKSWEQGSAIASQELQFFLQTPDPHFRYDNHESLILSRSIVCRVTPSRCLPFTLSNL
ncbi:MAG: hypothetical protein RI580_13170 [Halothece sp. Uz-M2-17]|nr:hypothetical protein [Halothece sp. Uz-M2-17]